NGVGTSVTLPARTVLVAAGTTPNITCEKEAPNTFQLDEKGKFFKPHRAQRNGDGHFHVTPDPDGFFTSYNSSGRMVSYYGDNHRRYAGNVGTAMAPGKAGSRKVLELSPDERARLDPAPHPERAADWGRLVAPLDPVFTATVQDVVRLTPTIVEVIVKA